MQSRRIRIYLAGIGLVSWRDAFRGDIPSPEIIDELYRARLVSQTQESSFSHVVALAFDGIYDTKGRLDKDKTIKYVSNEAVLDLMHDSPKFLLGASVNPTRRDWKDELEKCLEAGAVLIKWLPSVMDFDPADPRIASFYDRLRETGTPILMHVGFEFALPTTKGKYSSISRLEAVLNSGVTVIAAHCCGGWPIPFIDLAWLWEAPTMRRLVEKYPNLYFDTAGMIAPHRKGRLINALADPVISQRIVNGTDYPVLQQPRSFWRQTRGIVLPSNFYEKDKVIKEQCGFTDDMLERGYKVIEHRFLPSSCGHAH